MSKHEPITAENARTYLDIDTGWLSAVKREASRGAKVSPWLIATLSARIALAEAIIAANRPSRSPHDLCSQQFLTAGDSDNQMMALNTHAQTGTCLEHGSQLSSGTGHAGISPSASGQRDQEAERPAVRNRGSR